MMDIRTFQRFSAAIKALRKQQCLSQRALAKALDVSPGYVGQWESGLSKPSCDVITKICALFQVEHEEHLQKLAYVEKAPTFIKHSVFYMKYECSGSGQTLELNPCEANIINLVRRLPPEQLPLLTQKLTEWVKAVEANNGK